MKTPKPSAPKDRAQAPVGGRRGLPDVLPDVQPGTEGGPGRCAPCPLPLVFLGRRRERRRQAFFSLVRKEIPVNQGFPSSYGSRSCPIFLCIFFYWVHDIERKSSFLALGSRNVISIHANIIHQYFEMNTKHDLTICRRTRLQHSNEPFDHADEGPRLRPPWPRDAADREGAGEGAGHPPEAAGGPGAVQRPPPRQAGGLHRPGGLRRRREGGGLGGAMKRADTPSQPHLARVVQSTSSGLWTEAGGHHRSGGHPIIQ